MSKLGRHWGIVSLLVVVAWVMGSREPNRIENTEHPIGCDSLHNQDVTYLTARQAVA